MPDNKAPYIADDTMRHYDELSQLGKRYHEGDKAVGAVTEYGNKAWGAGNNSAHGDYAHSMSMGGVGGGLAGLLHEALRNKTEREKNQTMGRKFMRYAGKGGLGALAGAGAGSLYQAAMHKVSADPRAMMDMGESGAAQPLNAINAANQTIKHYSNAYNQGNQPAVQGYAKQHQSLMQGASAANKQMGGPAIPTNPLPSTIAPAAPPAAAKPPMAPVGAAKAAASEWKAVDLAKNPINWSRVLPKADASAKNWQGTGGQQQAAPAMKPVAPPMAPVGATKTSSGEKLRVMREVEDQASDLQRKGNLKHVANTRKNDTYAGNSGRGVTAQHVSRLANQAMQQLGDQIDKTSQLRNFGTKVAAGFNIGDLAKNIPEGLKKVMPAAGAGALGGAALGGLHGLIAPGHEDIYDDAGNVVGRQQRSRFGAALRGALGGGAAGGLAGGALEAYSPGAMGKAQDWLKGQYTKGREAIDPRFARQNAVNRVNAGNPAATAEADVASGEEWPASAPSPVMSEAEGRLQQQLGQESAVANAQRQLGIR